VTATDGTIEKLAELIRENQPVVALTGAGISQESGIPTFRGPDPLPEEDRDKGNVSTETPAAEAGTLQPEAAFKLAQIVSAV
jgi:hypothetical protein